MINSARLLGLVVALTGGLVLAGCGSNDSTIDGSGYTFQLPNGWEVLSLNETSSFRPDAFIGVPGGEHPRPNVNVTVSPIGARASLDRYFQRGLRPVLRTPAAFGYPPGTSLVAAGDASAAKLAGEPARQQDLVAHTRNEQLRQRVIMAFHDGTSYDITFTDVKQTFRHNLRGLSTVLRTWEWD